jgi:hypothetical protein
VTPPLAPYLALQLAALAAAATIAWRRRAVIGLLSPGYRAFLARPWRLVAFAISGGAITLLAPWTGDPTWDRVDGALMSACTYLTAPWALGTLYRLAARRASPADAFVAVVAWLFSASWSYDLWLLLRDGHYPGSWLANLGASSVLYAAAGLLWSLDWREGRGVDFAFRREGWPDGGGGPFRRVAWLAAPFMALAGAAIGWFLWSAAGRRPGG